jgi:hypothetical protein
MVVVTLAAVVKAVVKPVVVDGLAVASFRPPGRDA